MTVKQHNIIHVGLCIIFLWLGICNITQAIKCPAMTHTQLFQHIPESIILNFNECK